MKKSSAIVWLVALIALLAGGVYACVFGFDAAGTGSAKEIKQGLDLAGGVSITYQVVGEEEPDKADMADTIYKLQRRVEGYSTESQVYQEGSDRINIEIPGVSDANAILEDLGKPGSLYFIRVTDADDIYRYLVERGIIVRNRNRVALCGNCLRITVGTPQENCELLSALRQYKS